MTDRRVAVITGPSAGVGRATAKLFAEHGFDVALLARGQAGLEGAADDVATAGGRPLLIPTDVSQFERVDAAATRVEEELGPIDVWVNDAMTTVFAPIWETKPADFRRSVEVTFLGQVWGTMAALARMRPRDKGNIVNVGSALAFVGIYLQAAPTTLGSWNKMLVFVDSFFPGFGNQYAALGAWNGQLMDQPLEIDRPSNLYEPADSETDFGAHGIFDDRAGGFMDPSFLKTLPSTAAIFVKALGRTASEKRQLMSAKNRDRATSVPR